jgi:hypothetical protein
MVKHQGDVTSTSRPRGTTKKNNYQNPIRVAFREDHLPRVVALGRGTHRPAVTWQGESQRNKCRDLILLHPSCLMLLSIGWAHWKSEGKPTDKVHVGRMRKVECRSKEQIQVSYSLLVSQDSPEKQKQKEIGREEEREREMIHTYIYT